MLDPNFPQVVELGRLRVRWRRTGGPYEQTAVTPCEPGHSFDPQLLELCHARLQDGQLLFDTTPPHAVIALHGVCQYATENWKHHVCDLVWQQLPEIVDVHGQPLHRIWFAPTVTAGLAGDGI